LIFFLACNPNLASTRSGSPQGIGTPVFHRLAPRGLTGLVVLSTSQTDFLRKAASSPLCVPPFDPRLPISGFHEAFPPHPLFQPATSFPVSFFRTTAHTSRMRSPGDVHHSASSSLAFAPSQHGSFPSLPPSQISLPPSKTFLQLRQRPSNSFPACF